MKGKFARGGFGRRLREPAHPSNFVRTGGEERVPAEKEESSVKKGGGELTGFEGGR